MLHGFFLALAFLPAAEARTHAYARPELLLDPAELAKPDVAKKYLILDARKAAAHKTGHVPGAAPLLSLTPQRLGTFLAVSRFLQPLKAIRSEQR